MRFWLRLSLRLQDIGVDRECLALVDRIYQCAYSFNVLQPSAMTHAQKPANWMHDSLGFKLELHRTSTDLGQNLRNARIPMLIFGPPSQLWATLNGTKERILISTAQKKNRPYSFNACNQRLRLYTIGSNIRTSPWHTERHAVAKQGLI